jgi:hypothetical protein
MQLIRFDGTRCRQIVLSGMRQYLKARSRGWTTLWTGEGRFAMCKPYRRKDETY